MTAPKVTHNPADLAMRQRVQKEVAKQSGRRAARKTGKLSKTSVALALAINSLVFAGVGYVIYDNWDQFTSQRTGDSEYTETTELEDDAPNGGITEEPTEAHVDRRVDQAFEVIEVTPDIDDHIMEDERDYVDEHGRVIVSLRPLANPLYAKQPSLHLYEHEPDVSPLGCGMQPKFDEFWVSGLDKTPEFQEFLVDYAERMRMPLEVTQRSSDAHKRALQLMLGLNECYEEYNKDTYDSVIGDKTRDAIRRFQDANRLTTSGEADNKTMQYLLHASAMRVMFNMYVLDYRAKEFDVETQGVFQLAWHESMYVHTAVSRTGADGIGQMIDSTFLAEMDGTPHSFMATYEKLSDGDVPDIDMSADEFLTSQQHDIWTGSYAMLTHCETLRERFNKAGCEDIYGAYQLGSGGYRALSNAANRTPNKQASKVTRGTVSNGYGHMTAANALNHVNGLIDTQYDRQRALQDIEFLENIMQARAELIKVSPDIVVATKHNPASGKF
jgi:hypothetical protein